MSSSDPDLPSLAALLRRVESRQLLGELVARYGMAVDDRDFDALARMFAPDGEFHGVRGRAAIVEFYRARTATFTTSSHYAHTWQFELLTDSKATGIVNAHAELCIDGHTVRIALRYLDDYVLGDDGWMFASRRLRFRYVLPFDEVAHRTGEPLRVRWPGQPPQHADLPDQLQTYIDSHQAPVAAAAPLKTRSELPS